MSYVLVVVDEVGVRTALGRGLRAEGMDVITADDGPGGLRQAITGAFDAIVLDVDLPGLSGYQVLVRLRGSGVDTPVLLVSADDGESARAKGFDVGADGYLVKPLSLLVLVAQLRALLRRRDALSSGGPRRRRVGDLLLDPDTRTATWKQRPVGLSPREYAVLHALVTRQGAVVSKAELQHLAWDGEGAVTPNAVEVYIGYVRRKLEHVGAVEVIRTVRGRGYQVARTLEDPTSPAPQKLAGSPHRPTSPHRDTRPGELGSPR